MPVDKPNILQDDSFEEDAVFASQPPQEAETVEHGPRGSHFASAASSTEGEHGAHKALASLPSFDGETDFDLAPVGTAPEAEADAAKKPPVLDATGPGPRALHVPVAEKAAMAKVEARSPHAGPGSPKASYAKASSKASKKKAQIKKYSRYNRRYLDRDQLGVSAGAPGAVVEPKGGGFVLLSDDGLAFSWLPFMVYGGVAALVCAAWCVVARVLAAAPLIPGDALLTVGLILLCVIVAAGLVLAGIAAKLTLDEDGAEAFDVFSSAIGKTAIAMVAAIVVWVICMAVATML